MKNIKIAIDGPAGSGKSTVSKLLSEKINFTYVDSGALYRSVTLYALNNKFNINDESSFLFLENIELTYKDNTILLEGVNISEDIRSAEVSNSVAIVASHKYVRDILVGFIRKLSYNNNVVMDGRDIGSVVFPDANLKLYLTADIKERARRRMIETNTNMDLSQMIKDIEKRDYHDMSRLESPLIISDDAIIIDTTNKSVEKVINKIINLMKDKKII